MHIAIELPPLIYVNIKICFVFNLGQVKVWAMVLWIINVPKMLTKPLIHWTVFVCKIKQLRCEQYNQVSANEHPHDLQWLSFFFFFFVVAGNRFRLLDQVRKQLKEPICMYPDCQRICHSQTLNHYSVHMVALSHRAFYATISLVRLLWFINYSFFVFVRSSFWFFFFHFPSRFFSYFRFVFFFVGFV